MNHTKLYNHFLILIFGIVLGAQPVFGVESLPDPGSPSGNGIQPYVPNMVNPKCSDLGLCANSFKPQPEPPGSGTYTYPDGINTVTITNNSITDANHFDWISDIPVCAVIVKGGQHASVFVYPLGSYGDTQLHTPINPENDKNFAISHIEFCYDTPPARGKIIIQKNVNLGCLRRCDKDITFTFTGDIAGSIKHNETIEVTDLLPGVYTSTETAFDDWFVGSIEIDDNNSSYEITDNGKIGTITFRLDPGETIKAVVYNTRPPVILATTSSAGGIVTVPGEGEFDYCSGESVCLKAEPSDPLFEHVGWTGTFSRTLVTDCNAVPTIQPGRICGEVVLGLHIPACTRDCTSLDLNQDHSVRAVFRSLLDTLYVDDDGRYDPGPFDPNLSDDRENGTKEHPFDSIQEAIEVAPDGAMVIVRPGIYQENLVFMGRSITVTSFDPDRNGMNDEYPILMGHNPGMAVVTFGYNEGLDTKLQGFVISGGDGRHAGGISCRYSSPSIDHCVIVGNRTKTLRGQGGAVECIESAAIFTNCTLHGNYGGKDGAGFYSENSDVVLLNCILSGNTPSEILSIGERQPMVAYSNVAGGYPGEGNIDDDPQFIQLGAWEHSQYPGLPSVPNAYYVVWVSGDYHLNQNSKSIDAGDPDMSVGNETAPHGDRINQGAYGGTNQATVTP